MLKHRNQIKEGVSVTKMTSMEEAAISRELSENSDQTKTSNRPTDRAFGNCRSVHHFQKIGRIGEGTYGFVYKALDKENNNKPVALKRIILHNEEADGFPLTSIREIRTLKSCDKCPFIVELLDVVVGKSRDAVFLAFEYCEHDLSMILKRIDHPFRESEVKTLILQLLEAVEFIHSKWIVHRDIKLANLLYTKHGQLKLADFGLARKLSVPAPTDLTPVVMTLWYRAPEVLLETGNYSFAVDCWSVGCILAELLDSRPLFDGDSEMETISSIFKWLGAPSERIWPEITQAGLVEKGVIDLWKEQRKYPYNMLSDRYPRLSQAGLDILQALLTYRPKNRLTAREARVHAYFETSPLPTSQDFMPTFPSFHEEDVKQNKLQQLQQQRTLQQQQHGLISNAARKSFSNSIASEGMRGEKRTYHVMNGISSQTNYNNYNNSNSRNYK